MKTILLVGNPNTGKTTLFNMLTKSSEHTGNWHGVTVDFKAKKFEYKSDDYVLVDLPGIYSLSPYSYEEKVAIDYILDNPQASVVCLCDCVNLKRNLYLATELISLGRQVIICINKTKKNFDENIAVVIEKQFGVSCVCVNANNRKEKNIIIEKIINTKNHNNEIKTKYISEINHFKKNLQPLQLKGINNDFYFSKLIYGDEYYLQKFNIKYEQIEKYLMPNLLENQIAEKYNLIEITIQITTKKNKVLGKSILDNIFLNKYLCLPIFFVIMTIVFYITFFSLGQYLSEILRNFIQNIIGKSVVCYVSSFCKTAWVIDLIEVGIFGGVGTIFSFLPQVVLLFVFLSILEDSGYISRLAFCVDDIFSKVGLSGKSVYTLLMGFGCSTTACLTARNMSDKNSKIKTAMLSPYMSCSAKLPVYAVIGGAFFGASNVFIVVLLYVLGIVCALVLSSFLEHSFLKTKEQSFILEFPSYKFPGIKRLTSVVYENVKLFIVRVGSLLIALNIIIWVLESFSFGFSYVKFTNQKSMLQCLGQLLAPIFVPLGFGSWGATSALLAGIIAKEVIVSSLAMFNDIESAGHHYEQKLSQSLTNSANAVWFTPQGAMSYMVFCLLYCPCIATISVLTKEIGKKWTMISVVLQFVIAYAMALITNLFFTLTEIYGYMWVLAVVICVSVIVLSFVCVFYKIKSKKLCVNCQGCVNGYCNKK